MRVAPRSGAAQGQCAAIMLGTVGGVEGGGGELALDLVGAEAGGKGHCAVQDEGTVPISGGGSGMGVVAEAENSPAGAVAEVMGAGLSGAGPDDAPERAEVAIGVAFPGPLPSTLRGNRGIGEERGFLVESSVITRSTGTEQGGEEDEEDEEAHGYFPLRRPPAGGRKRSTGLSILPIKPGSKVCKIFNLSIGHAAHSSPKQNRCFSLRK